MEAAVAGMFWPVGSLPPPAKTLITPDGAIFRTRPQFGSVIKIFPAASLSMPEV